MARGLVVWHIFFLSRRSVSLFVQFLFLLYDKAPRREWKSPPCVAMTRGRLFFSLLMHPWCAVTTVLWNGVLKSWLAVVWTWIELTGTSWFGEQAEEIEGWNTSYTPNVWRISSSLPTGRIDAWNTKAIRSWHSFKFCLFVKIWKAPSEPFRIDG